MELRGAGHITVRGGGAPPNQVSACLPPHPGVAREGGGLEREEADGGREAVGIQHVAAARTEGDRAAEEKVLRGWLRQTAAAGTASCLRVFPDPLDGVAYFSFSFFAFLCLLLCFPSRANSWSQMPR